MQFVSDNREFLLGGSGRKRAGMKIRDDAADAVAGSTVIVDVLANDTPPKNDSLIVIAATADKGTVSVGPDSRLSVSTAGLSAGDSPVSVTYTALSAKGGEENGQLVVTLWPPLVAKVPGPLTGLEGSAPRWSLVPDIFAGGRAPVTVHPRAPFDGPLSLDGQTLVADDSGGGFMAKVALEATDALGQLASADLAVRVDETLTVASGGALLSFVGTGGDPIAVTIPAGVPYAGDYVLDPALVNGVPPRLVAPGTEPALDLAAGRLLPGLFYSDPATGGSLEVSIDWRDGAGQTLATADPLAIPAGAAEVRIGAVDANGPGPVYRLDIPAVSATVLDVSPAGLTLVSAPAVPSPAVQADTFGLRMGEASAGPDATAPVFATDPAGLTLVSASAAPLSPILADTAGLHMEAA